MDRKIREYATHLMYTLDGTEKSKTYHQVSREQAINAVEERIEYATELGGKDIECDVIYCESTIH